MSPAATSAPTQPTVLLRRQDVARLLRMPDCIEAVELAFLRHAQGRTIPPAVLGVHVEGGGFHVKAAGLIDAIAGRPVFAAKVNANFPGNPDRTGLPTIQGMIALFDASDGRVLALLDSIEITSLRTGAATAVAARYLARPGPATVTIYGCGEQGRYQLRALACVRPLARVMVIDVSADRAARFATLMGEELDVDVRVVPGPDAAARETSIWVTCTPARRWYLGRRHVAAGAFVAAVGADNPEKQEIEPELLAASAVVADVLDQCLSIGDLHHAIAAGTMRREDVRAELAEVVSGSKKGRQSAHEVIVFDSTGTALEDVAAAALVYERAVLEGAGIAVALGGAR
ncbi:MAG TPA: ornithine cyclodeaminase family protein [Gemmatimonadales bacterium]|jgi:ornithine cyclodeaminase/alanine dehydrogenase-like protein (mu-crystallin family)